MDEAIAYFAILRISPFRGYERVSFGIGAIHNELRHSHFKGTNEHNKNFAGSANRRRSDACRLYQSCYSD
ncbi:hypothetical protein AwEntero_05560 [Enterobacterales bacterium]|nr:hypothetical protein AwEntero_05560 [Enterobacterales bacterium]